MSIGLRSYSGLQAQCDEHGPIVDHALLREGIDGGHEVELVQTENHLPRRRIRAAWNPRALEQELLRAGAGSWSDWPM